MEEHNIRLTSAEISSLWANYIGDSMSICVFKYFLSHIEDSEIKVVLEHAIDLSKQHVKTIGDIFKKEGIAIPKAFGDEDVNVGAKRLFADTLHLSYVKNMAKGGLAVYAAVLPNISRGDIRSYFSKCIQSTIELYNETTDLLLSKGLEVRPPYIPYPKEVDFVHKQHFLAGWLGEQRPLTAQEITQMFANVQTNKLGESIVMGFAQVAHDKEIQKYMVRGREISKKHIEVFSTYLNKDDLPSPMSSDNEVTDSTEAPFSDKLMMYHVGILSSSGMANYGTAMSLSPRHDIAVDISRLLVEVGLFAEDGANITIKNNWLERPPSAADRDELVKKKG